MMLKSLFLLLCTFISLLSSQSVPIVDASSLATFITDTTVESVDAAVSHILEDYQTEGQTLPVAQLVTDHRPHQPLNSERRIEEELEARLGGQRREEEEEEDEASDDDYYSRGRRRSHRPTTSARFSGRNSDSEPDQPRGGYASSTYNQAQTNRDYYGADESSSWQYDTSGYTGSSESSLRNWRYQGDYDATEAGSEGQIQNNYGSPETETSTSGQTETNGASTEQETGAEQSSSQDDTNNNQVSASTTTPTADGSESQGEETEAAGTNSEAGNLGQTDSSGNSWTSDANGGNNEEIGNEQANDSGNLNNNGSAENNASTVSEEAPTEESGLTGDGIDTSNQNVPVTVSTADNEAEYTESQTNPQEETTPELTSSPENPTIDESSEGIETANENNIVYASGGENVENTATESTENTQEELNGTEASSEQVTTSEQTTASETSNINEVDESSVTINAESAEPQTTNEFASESTGTADPAVEASAADTTVVEVNESPVVESAGEIQEQSNENLAGEAEPEQSSGSENSSTSENNSEEVVSAGNTGAENIEAQDETSSSGQNDVVPESENALDNQAESSEANTSAVQEETSAPIALTGSLDGQSSDSTTVDEIQQNEVTVAPETATSEQVEAIETELQPATEMTSQQLSTSEDSGNNDANSEVAPITNEITSENSISTTPTTSPDSMQEALGVESHPTEQSIEVMHMLLEDECTLDDDGHCTLNEEKEGLSGQDSAKNTIFLESESKFDTKEINSIQDDLADRIAMNGERLEKISESFLNSLTGSAKKSEQGRLNSASGEEVEMNAQEKQADSKSSDADVILVQEVQSEKVSPANRVPMMIVGAGIVIMIYLSIRLFVNYRKEAKLSKMLEDDEETEALNVNEIV